MLQITSLRTVEPEVRSREVNVMPVVYHEAGQAVIAVLLGVEIESAIATSGGATINYHLPLHLLDDDRIMLAMAGNIAELARARQWKNRISIEDATKWRPFVEHIPEAARHRHLARLRRDTHALLRRHWSAVDYIAQRLATPGTMSGDEIKQIVERTR
jgi:hypothetical protein